MQRYLLFALTAFLWLIFGCQSDQQGKTGFTEDGHAYVIHTNSKNKKGLPGDHLFFHSYWRNKDQVVISSRTTGSGQVNHMEVPKDISILSPFDKFILSLAAGDSATVSVRIDTLPSTPQGFEGSDYMHIDIAMQEIQSPAEFQIELDRQRTEEAKAREEILARRSTIKGEVDAIIAKYKAGELDNKMEKHPTGLIYVQLEEGTGERPVKGQQVYVNYYGCLNNGQMFDNSFDHGAPYRFVIGVGSVVRGWDIGVGMMKEGGKALLILPPDLAYGATGTNSIPPNSELTFYVELNALN